MSLMTMVEQSKALPGREIPMSKPQYHEVNQHEFLHDYSPHLSTIYFAMGCFWGGERLFWQQEGVWITAVGYQGGFTPHPTYAEVCTGLTGHAESIQVVYDPAQISIIELLELFWTRHDPTQGMRQGVDQGTQYRSAIYWTIPLQEQLAYQTQERYQKALGPRLITTEIQFAKPFYFAEVEHQQYLAKHPMRVCSLSGCGVTVDFSGI